jgi:hypothetical protein
MSETLRPFENEQDSLVIDALTIENRIDQLEVYGSLAITRDKIGLAHALQLKQILDASGQRTSKRPGTARPDRVQAE